MGDQTTYYDVICLCGHRAYIATSRWLYRDEVIRRFRCGRCDRKDIRDLVVVVPWRNNNEIGVLKPELMNVPVHEV